MLQRILVFGFLGPLVLVGGCGSGKPGEANLSGRSTASATRPTEGTKQVTLAVSGMT
jgi:hypothetical protein